jgi:hypothetical protein
MAELWQSGTLGGGPATPGKKEEGEAPSTVKQEREGRADSKAHRRGVG